MDYMLNVKQNHLHLIYSGIWAVMSCARSWYPLTYYLASHSSKFLSLSHPNLSFSHSTIFFDGHRKIWRLNFKFRSEIIAKFGRALCDKQCKVLTFYCTKSFNWIWNRMCFVQQRIRERRSSAIAWATAAYFGICHRNICQYLNMLKYW